MLKVLKKLIKSDYNYNKRYIIVYQESMYSDYEFMRCDEEELKKVLAVNELFDYHVFLAKDELEIETEFKIEVE